MNYAVDFSPDGREVAVGHPDGSIRLYDLTTGQESRRFSAGPEPAWISFRPDGQELAVSGDREVQIREVKTGNVVTTLPHPAQVEECVWRPDGKLLACACHDFRVYVWDVAARRTVTVLEGHAAEAILVTFSHRGDLLCSTGWDGFTRLWNPVTGRQLVYIHGAGLRFSMDDQRLGYIGPGPEVGVWEMATGRECRTLAGHQGGKGPWSVDFSPDGRLMASASYDGVRLWDVAAAWEIDWAPVGSTLQVLFEPSGESLISSGSGGLYRLPIERHATPHGADVRFGPPQAFQLPPGTLPVWACLTPDGRTLAVAGNRSQAVLIDAVSGNVKAVLAGQPGLAHIKISPDGHWVAASTWGNPIGSVRVWDARSGKPVRDLPGTLSARLTFSPDGRSLVTSSVEGCRVWQVGSWQPGRRIPLDRAEGVPGAVAFTRDGAMMAIGCDAPVVKLVDPRTGQQLANLEAPDSKQLLWLCFSPDGSLLAAATPTHAIQLWDLRLIRRQLAAMHLDWEPPRPPLGKPALTSGTSQARRPFGASRILPAQRARRPL